MGSSSTSHRRPNRRNASNQPSHWKSEQIATMPPPAMVRVASSIGGTRSVPLPSPRHESAARAKRSKCPGPLRRGIRVRTLSSKVTKPARSPPRVAAAAKATAACAPVRILASASPAKDWLALSSRRTRSRSSRSSWKTLTCGSPARAVTFQSINRTSSPGV